MIDIQLFEGKGRGVIACHAIASGTLIERAPVIAFPAEERDAINKTALFPYYFVDPGLYGHGKASTPGFFALGRCTLCNHADRPNAIVEWVRDDVGPWAEFIALVPIEAGEEITLYYSNLDEYEGAGSFF